MVELYGVDNADRLGDGIYNFVTAVVVDGRANANPSCAQKYQVLCGPGLLWMETFHPMGLNGVAS